jgi:hypothetical protein
MRKIFAVLFSLSCWYASAQFFVGTGIDYRIPSAERLVSTQSTFSQLGYRWGEFGLVGQFQIPSGTTHWSKPEPLYGARLEWMAYTLPTDSLTIPILKSIDWNIMVSGQWNRLNHQRQISEHLGPFDVDHWSRAIYQFEYAKNEFLIGLGLVGNYGPWTGLLELQFGPQTQFDTWVYQSKLYGDGQEVVTDNYYYFENYSTLRFNFTLRRDLYSILRNSQ